jgi:hypothetical protein
MDSIRVSEAPDPGSIPGEATKLIQIQKGQAAAKNLLIFYMDLQQKI